jgi:cell division transport system ATP-binding protein
MIRFENVTHDFGVNELPALADISFAVEEGEFVFLTGHSGSGKTTILRLLLRELQPSGGTVFFQGQDLSQLSRRKVAKHRQKVGVVFQDYQLLDDLTVQENIALPLIIAKVPRAEINERIAELLKLLGLEGLEEAFPAQLSGGEAQRVGLARALTTAPQIVFADEPTGNLDQANALAILNLLQGINHYGTTIIFATHNLDLLQQVEHSRHLQLEQGKLVKDSGSKKTPAGKTVPASHVQGEAKAEISSKSVGTSKDKPKFRLGTKTEKANNKNKSAPIKEDNHE